MGAAAPKGMPNSRTTNPPRSDPTMRAWAEAEAAGEVLASRPKKVMALPKNGLSQNGYGR